MMMSEAANMMSNEVDMRTILQLSSMALDPQENMTKEQADDSSASSTLLTSSISSVSSSSQLSGWSNLASKKACICLRTLEAESKGTVSQERIARRRVQEIPPLGDTWGYFVDTL